MSDFLGRLGRKLTTRPVWYWQRHRPYPIRRRVDRFPPQPWRADAACTCVVLTTPRTLTNALWAAYSFGRSLADRAGLALVLDGVWSERERIRVRRLFPTAELRETAAEVAALADGCPRLAELARRHPMGRKLAAILAAQMRGGVIFADDDVLALGGLPELHAHLAGEAAANLYLREQGGVAQADPAVQAAAAQLGLPMRTDINVGLLALRRHSLDPQLAERVLAVAGTPGTWFPDTSLLAILLAATPAQPLPDSYLVSTAGQFWSEPRVKLDALEVRHYVGPVRHLMYREGMPWLWRRVRPDRRR